MIIIADAHIDESRGNESVFFQMLDAIEKTDQDVVFLGDIFELWIALPHYEKGSHRSFLTWCETQKRRRTVGFMQRVCCFATAIKSIAATKIICFFENFQKIKYARA